MQHNLKAVAAAIMLVACAGASATAAFAKTQKTYIQPFKCDSKKMMVLRPALSAFRARPQFSILCLLMKAIMRAVYLAV